MSKLKKMKLTENQRDNLTMIVEFIGGITVFLIVAIESLYSNLIFRAGMCGIMLVGLFIKIKIWRNYDGTR